MWDCRGAKNKSQDQAFSEKGALNSNKGQKSERGAVENISDLTALKRQKRLLGPYWGSTPQKNLKYELQKKLSRVG